VTRAAPDTVEVALPSHPKYLPLVRALVEHGAALAGFDADDCGRIVLAVTEGVTNVIRHGYQGDTARPIGLRLETPAGLFRLEIRDRGRFVDPSEIRSRPLGEVRPGGLGVHLMQATMDTVSWERNEHGGTTLTLAKHLPVPRKTP
jgi:anti-sigma regulatory factor (Ser/Thr protein kinase)